MGVGMSSASPFTRWITDTISKKSSETLGKKERSHPTRTPATVFVRGVLERFEVCCWGLGEATGASIGGDGWGVGLADINQIREKFSV